ncbi:MAG: [Clostridia bacterium]|nr:[FeFe] hydrogenase H-cluster radical SAM maturase HydE [Clostridia bacterium]
MNSLIPQLAATRDLPNEQLKALICDESATKELAAAADLVRREVYGEDVYIRGLIELTNYCKNNCYYCGIRRDNREVTRYRLTKEQVLACCKNGYELGFRTFVLQGGEDPYFSTNLLCDLVASIKSAHPDCAVTLSMGEHTKEDYKTMFAAGADRYLLRHETANPCHYGQLHPKELTADERKRCLFDLKEIGFQVGAGFMVGSPYQTADHLVEDLRFLQQLD